MISAHTQGLGDEDGEEEMSGVACAEAPVSSTAAVATLGRRRR